MALAQTQEITVTTNAGITADVDAVVAANAGLRLMGWSARESAGSPAVAAAKIVNGATGAAAGKVANIGLAASTSRGEWYGPEGIPCPLGLSIDHIAGTLDIILYYRVAS
jgi:hypothetical protein